MKKSDLLGRPIVIAVLIGLISLLARMALIVSYKSFPLAGGDQTAYWSFAEGIARGEGFRSSFEPWLADRPPLYSYFLAAIFFIGGKDLQTVFVAQAVLGAFASAIFYLCSARALDKFGQLAAGLIFAVFPSTLLFTQQILTEALYIPLWVFLLAGLLALNERSDARAAIGAGVLLGLLALVRREAVLPGCMLVVTLSWIFAHADWKKFLQSSAMIFVIAGIMVLPWLVRNYHVLGKPVLSSSAGVNFMVGNNPLGNGAYTPPPLDWQAQFSGLGELERNQKAWELSLQWIRENPADYLGLLPRKLFVLWDFAHNAVLDLGDILLTILCLPGLIGLIQRRQNWKLLTAVCFIPIFTTTLIGLVMVGAWRYRILVYPGLFMLAGYGVTQIRSWYLSLRHQLPRPGDASVS